MRERANHENAKLTSLRSRWQSSLLTSNTPKQQISYCSCRDWRYSNGFAYTSGLLATLCSKPGKSFHDSRLQLKHHHHLMRTPRRWRIDSSLVGIASVGQAEAAVLVADEFVGRPFSKLARGVEVGDFLAAAWER